ncbi:hypothetical protein [Methylobrevis pamukkalensis]|uniref:Uncharacterized protein n=1 Tax=Methylobrevis pamukkalensis TaxID=1439726 RepID=A0A1E3GX07_9HYPH|nr:hypothetical protein [Methylobrevis pamukkalensis]ODN68588.1 hypothetical protein A6302_04117 [Methylobrevis pamukkalensis]
MSTEHLLSQDTPLFTVDGALPQRAGTRRTVVESYRLMRLVALLVFIIAATFAGMASAAPNAPDVYGPNENTLWKFSREAAEPLRFQIADVAAPGAQVSPASPARTTREPLFDALFAQETGGRGMVAGIIGVLLAGMLGLTAVLWHEFGSRLGLTASRSLRG